MDFMVAVKSTLFLEWRTIQFLKTFTKRSNKKSFLMTNFLTNQETLLKILKNQGKSSLATVLSKLVFHLSRGEYYGELRFNMFHGQSAQNYHQHSKQQPEQLHSSGNLKRLLHFSKLIGNEVLCSLRQSLFFTYPCKLLDCFWQTDYLHFIYTYNVFFLMFFQIFFFQI